MENVAQQLKAYFEPVVQLVKPNYRQHGIPARVVSRRDESSDMYTLAIKPSKRHNFTFVPGQHISMRVEINGRTMQRIFSISSSYNTYLKSNMIEISIKKINDGLVTNWLADALDVNTKVYIDQAFGDFFLAENHRMEPKLFAAAGSGITPILSILESVSCEALKNYHLLYCVKQKSSMPFSDRLHSLSNKGLNLLIIETGSQGRPNDETVDTLLGSTKLIEVFSCGPNEFPNHIKNLIENRCASKQLPVPIFRSESFGLRSRNTAAGEKGSIVRFLPKTGRFFTIPNKSDKPLEHLDARAGVGTLLEAAEENGLNPVYGCRAGICHQCVTRKTSGRVKNVITGQVSNEGEEDIQLCVCVAETDVTLQINERTVQ